MSLSIRSRFILISVSITLLALLLFTSVIHKRVTKYKYQAEFKTNHILADQIYQRLAAEKDLNKIKNFFTKKNQSAQAYAILNNNNNEILVIENNKLESSTLNKIFAEIKKKNIEGRIKDNNGDYIWITKDSPEFKNKFLLVYSSLSFTLFEFIKFFGLPFLISGFLLCWVMVWASIILSSLVVKLQKQKQILSDQSADIKKARDDAMQANLAKSNFLANMSHEIRTPLTSIIGFAESCVDIDQTSKERSKATKTIINNGKHLMHIINEILDLSKIEAGKLEVEISPFSILSMLDDVNQLVSIMAKDKGIKYDINYIYPLPETIKSDELRLKQILLNLCSNAIKFTPVGHVDLSMSYEEESSMLIFEVVDTGIGLTEEQQENIFKPFEQADVSITRKFGGTGLGLTLSYQFVELLKGELLVESKVNHGSRFTVKINIPKVDSSDLIYASNHEHAWISDVKNHTERTLFQGKVLVAEDNLDIQDLVRLLFKRVGINPDIVDNGQLAVERALSEGYDLILMDMQMPVMDGLTAMNKLKQLNCNTPVIAMTANAMKKDRDNCKEAGFSDFVSKPIDRSYFYSILKDYLRPRKKLEVDETVLTSNLLNDEPDLIDLIDKFMARLPSMQDAINVAHSEGSTEEFSGLIHQLKGVGGGYGYPMLTDLCTKIEFQITAKNTQNVITLIEEFNLMVAQILEGSDENHKIAAR